MRDLTEGAEGKSILLFALPMLLGNVFQQLYNVVDSVVVGNYIGKEALAAVGASFPIVYVLISLIIGITSGSTIIIAQFYGAKDIANVRRAIDTTFIFLFFASIVIGIAGIASSSYIFNLIKLPEELIPQATLYFNIFIAGIIFMFGYNGTSAILRGLGDSKTPLYFLVISTVLNIILDLLFVLVFKWGIAGVAIATMIAQFLAFITAIIYLNKYHTVIQFSFKNLKFDRRIFYSSVRIGLPSGLQQTFVALGMLALYRIINDYGTDAVAAYTIASRIDSFAMMPTMNFAFALSTFVGQNLGANKLYRIRKGYNTTLMLTGGISVAVSILVIFTSTALMRLFTGDAMVIEIGKSYLIIVSAFYIIFSGMFVTNAIFRGVGDTVVPMLVTLVSLWALRIPIAYFLSKHIGTNGIWWAIPIAWTVGMICAFVYYYSGIWKRRIFNVNKTVGTVE